MILFKEIYNKAINLFDDPDIQRAYFQDTVQWEKMMYPYLQSCLSLFTNPTRISSLLIDQSAPEGIMEVFSGNGSATYTLSTTPHAKADFTYMIAGELDPSAVYDAVTNSVTFSKVVPIGTECSVEWYFCGAFNTDFASAASATTTASVISYRVVEILARALVLNWAENEKNFVLEIRNILTDTDFKMYSPANATRSKIEWVKQLRADFDTMTNKLGWDLFSRKYHGGQYYG